MNESEPPPVFDEAARLYVQYLPVVQEMERAFLSSLDKFWSNIRKTIDNLAAPLQVEDEDHGRLRIWWLCGTKDAPGYPPYLWFDGRKPEIVIPGQLEFTVDIEREGKTLRPEIEKALRSLPLPSHCSQKKKAAEGGVATYLISYGKSAQAVQDVAEVLVLILRAIEPLKK